MSKIKSHLVLSFDSLEESEHYYKFFLDSINEVSIVSLFDDKRSVDIISTLIVNIEQEEK